MSDQNSTVKSSDLTVPENAEDHESSIERSIAELWPYGKPYSPSSATNFEALTELSLSDPGGLTQILYDPEWLDTPFGRYDSLYFPDSINHRYDVGTLYSSGSRMRLSSPVRRGNHASVARSLRHR